jgi:hypothetical protein
MTLPLLPIPGLTGEELVFALIVFTAAMMILMNIKPLAVMGAVFLWVLLVSIDLLGPSPYLFILVVLIAAIVRITVPSLINVKNEGLDPEDAETLYTLATIIEATGIFGNRRDDE